MNKIRYPGSGGCLGESGRRYELKPNHSVSFIHSGECYFNENQGAFSQDVSIEVKVAEQHGAIVGHECRHDQNCKAVDLSVLLVNKNTSEVDSYFYDVKDTFHGVDVISHFAQQLAESISYAQNCISAAEASSGKISVGVLVGLYSSDRLRETIRKEEELLKNTNESNGIDLKASMVLMRTHEKPNSQETNPNYGKINNAKNVLNGQIELLGRMFDLDVFAFATADCMLFDQVKSQITDAIIHNVDIVADESNVVRIHTLNSVLNN